MLGDQPKKPIPSQRSLHQQKDHQLIFPSARRDQIPHCGRDNQWGQLYVWESSLLSICVVIQSYLKGLKSRQRLRRHAAPACRRSWHFLSRSPTVALCSPGEWEDLQGVSRHYESYRPLCSPSVPIPIINIRCSTFINSLAISCNQAHHPHRSVVRRHLIEAT